MSCCYLSKDLTISDSPSPGCQGPYKDKADALEAYHHCKKLVEPLITVGMVKGQHAEDLKH